MIVKNFRTYQIAREFYRVTQTLSLERHLKEQLSRATSSVALNLAEGAGRLTKADQKRFYSIALGSLRESQAILDLAGLVTTEIEELTDKLAAHIFKLIKANAP